MNAARVVLAAALAAALAAGCTSDGGRPSNLAGRWVNADAGGAGMELFKDGTGVAGDEPVTWKVENKRFVIISSAKGKVYDYNLSGYELVLVADDGDSARFVRKESLKEYAAKREAKAAPPPNPADTAAGSRAARAGVPGIVSGEIDGKSGAGAGPAAKVGGDSGSRAVQMGVLGIASGRIEGKSKSVASAEIFGEGGGFADTSAAGVSGGIKSKSVASADLFGKGGFATDTDYSAGGLKSGGGADSRRKGVAGIGFGSGYGSGFGGAGGGVDDVLGGRTGGEGGGLELKKKGELKVSSPDFLKGGLITGSRSRASIQRVVMQNMAALRYAYNKRLREKPGLTGKITVKFAIDEFGKVLSAQLMESTMADPELDATVISRVKSWNFEKIDVPGDVTEVTYPFVFSQ